MTPTPVALGLTLCDYLLLEEGTRKPSLIGCFTALKVATFPSSPRPFFAFAELTDGSGPGHADLSISRLDTDDVIYRQGKSLDFKSRFHVIRYGTGVGNCVFPVPGKYLVTLSVDGVMVAQRELGLTQRGVPP